MNKAQLVDAVTDRLGGRQSAADAVDAVLDAIVRAVVGGDRVSITGFGSFEKVSRSARYARNPQTGERIRVKKTSAPRFRAGQGFKDLVSGSKKLPRGGEIAVKKAPKGSLQVATTKKVAAKKTTAAAKKVAAKEPTAAAAKKTTTTAAKETTTAKKAAAKKMAPAKKATAKKAAARTTTARKTAAKKIKSLKTGSGGAD